MAHQPSQLWRSVVGDVCGRSVLSVCERICGVYFEMEEV